MDKVKIDEVIKFIEQKGIKVIRVFEQIDNGVVFDIVKNGSTGKAICFISNIELLVCTDMNSILDENFDWSEEWIEHLINSRPDLKSKIIYDMNTKFNAYVEESEKELSELRKQYTEKYNQICAGGIRLQNLKNKVNSCCKSVNSIKVK